MTLFIAAMVTFLLAITCTLIFSRHLGIAFASCGPSISMRVFKKQLTSRIVMVIRDWNSDW
jgi:hypothetical protein